MDEKAYLEIEVAKGQAAQRALDDFFDPFFEAKTLELFTAFKALSATEPDKLMVVKMQANSLESLRDEIVTIVNTGKLASKAINDEETKNDN